MVTQNDQLHEKWKKWLDHLSDEVIELHANRHIFQDVQDIISQNPSMHTQLGAFNEWMAQNQENLSGFPVRSVRDL